MLFQLTNGTLNDFKAEVYRFTNNLRIYRLFLFSLLWFWVWERCWKIWLSVIRMNRNLQRENFFFLQVILVKTEEILTNFWQMACFFEPIQQNIIYQEPNHLNERKSKWMFLFLVWNAKLRHSTGNMFQIQLRQWLLYVRNIFKRHEKYVEPTKTVCKFTKLMISRRRLFIILFETVSMWK